MIIFLHGPDTFRSKRKLAEFKGKFIREIDKSGLNIEQIDASNLDFSALEKAVLTPPFLVKKRMVIINNLLSEPKNKILHENVEKLLAKTQVQKVIIIFWEGDLGATAQKTALAKKLINEKLAHRFDLLDTAGLSAWTLFEIKKRGSTISKAALSLLCAEVGSNLWQMNSEIEKLTAATGKKEITENLVKELVAAKLQEDIYQLTDAIGQKNSGKAVLLIREHLESGTAPLELLGKITWQFRNLLLVKEFIEKNGQGYAPDRIAFQLKLHPYVVKKTLSHAKNFSLSSIKTQYAILLDADRKMKSTNIDPELLLSLMVVRK